MKRLELTLESPAANLALDDALLDRAEHQAEQECLRFWEPTKPFVVLGRSSPYLREVNLTFCSANGIPILRRSSGGATVVAGPGCLMYAVILDLRQRPELSLVDQAHQFVLQRMVSALERLGVSAQIAGTSDLTLQGQKFSGNSLRCRRQAIVYHGTLLLDLPPELIQSCLERPVRQPAYRADRSHREFLKGLNLRRAAVVEAIAEEWKAVELEAAPPLDATWQLVQEKYGTEAWTRKVLD